MQYSFPENSIPESHAAKLIAAHDGSMALLYIWLCSSKSFDAEKAAGELCLTISEVNAAFEKLCRCGVLSGAEKPAPAEELPEYKTADIVSRSEDDPAFTAILRHAEQLRGKTLTHVETNKLFGIYNYLALPADVIFLLLTHCFEMSKEKYGPGRSPSMRSIEEEAYRWHNMEILTCEQAEEYIVSYNEKNSAVERIKTALGIFGRQLTSTERNYISSWIDMGFGADVIALAYDRTVTNTGSLKWSYMNKIILSWNGKGLRTVSEIEEKDCRTPILKAENGHPETISTDESSRLKAIYDKVKNN